MVDLLTLLGSIGGGITDVISQSSELVVSTNGTTKILTLNLSGYLSSSHEAGKVGNAKVRETVAGRLHSPIPRTIISAAQAVYREYENILNMRGNLLF